MENEKKKFDLGLAINDLRHNLFAESVAIWETNNILFLAEGLHILIYIYGRKGYP